MPRHDDHDQTRRFPGSASSRRGLLKGAAALGLATPALRTLGVGAGTVPGSAPISFARYQADASTLVIGLDNPPSDRDPHSQYDYRSTLVVRGVYETLIHLVGSATDQYEGRIAESWEANEDQSVWTFKIRPGRHLPRRRPLRRRGGESVLRAVASHEHGRGCGLLPLHLRPGADDDPGRRHDRLRLRQAAAALRGGDGLHLRAAGRQRQGRNGATRRTATSATPGCGSTPRAPAPAPTS